MTTWNPQANTLFLQALELRSPAERLEFLDRTCADNAELRAEVEAMLAASDIAGSFLEASPAGMAPTVGQTRLERPGTVIGPYKLLQQIGEGGMGTVYMAEQSHPVQRKVALKVIKAGMDSGQVIARFEAERQALALMDHPNIAKVLDAGTIGEVRNAECGVRSENMAAGAPTTPHSELRTPHSVGRPYFVMELVKGVPITQYCDENHLPPKARLELFTQVCQAVQHAHQKGIIHRDLKPTNVLVTQYDGQPVPKVIDFGVNKATGAKLTERTLFTEFGQVVGTLEYMSPGQAEANQLDVDTRSDIYSLGVLLYELLTGTTPLERKQMKAVALLEVLRLIREEEPPKPSTRLSTGDGQASIAVNRGMEPKKLSGLVRGELDWIVMKALEKDRNRRYETANGLAMDVQRYLADEHVLACPPSAAYRFRKFARRNRVVIMTAALVSAALVLGTVVSTWQAIRATTAEWRTSELLISEQQARHEADGAREQELEQRRVAEEARREEAKQRQAAEDSAAKAQKNYETARQAVQQMLTRVADQQLSAIPKMKEVRIQLLEDAAVFHAELLKMNPGDARAYSQRGYVYYLLGKYEQARADYEKAVELDPADAECHHRLAWLFVLCPDVAYRDLNRALVHARRAVELAPRHALHSNLLAKTYDFLGDYDQALSQLDRTIELDPAFAPAYESRSEAYSRAGDHQRALMDALKGVELGPSSPFNYKRLTEAYLAVNQGEQALAAANRALEVNPIPNALTTFHLYNNRGGVYQHLGMYEAALADYDELIQLAPFRSYSYKLRAASHFALKDYEKALADIGKAVELKPDDLHNLTCLGLEEVARCPSERLRAGLLELADQSIQLMQRTRGSVSWPTTIPPLPSEAALQHAYATRARLHAAFGLPAKAVADYRRVLELHEKPASELPQNPGYRNELAGNLAKFGLALEKGQRHQEAEDALSEAVALWKQLSEEYPDSEWYRQERAHFGFALARILQNAGQREAAVEHCRTSVQLNERLVVDFAEKPVHKSRLA